MKLTPERFHRILTGSERTLAARLWRVLFRVVAPVYAWVLRLRNARWDRADAEGRTPAVSVPVFSVGNLTLGGTGKTPTVIRLARLFAERGHTVAVLSRGYRAPKQDGPLPRLNDEGLEILRRCPDVILLQNPDRVASARTAVEVHHADVLVLDDGFQHRRLHRDADLVLLDVTQPLGLTGRTFPLGTLREPAEALRRADCVILTHCERVEPGAPAQVRERLQNTFPVRPDAIWVEAQHAPVGWVTTSGELLPLDALRDREAGVFCAVGNPDGFLNLLAGLHVRTVGDPRLYPDHHAYGPDTVRELGEWGAALGLRTLLCTEKDLVKLPDGVPGVEVFALRVEMSFGAGEAEFLRWLGTFFDVR